MNKFDYTDINIGFMECFTASITEDMMTAFLEISGDNNPLHCDAVFAQSKGFCDRVVYGMLVASLYSRLAGVYLPGERCILQSVNSDFLKPVYINDDLLVTGKVVEKNDSVKQLIVKAWIENQKGERVSKARIEMGVL